MAKKQQQPDEETLAVIHWCVEVEGHLVAGGATMAQAQEFIEAEIELLTDYFYDGFSPEQAAQKVLDE